MTINDANGSVHDEQFGKSENTEPENSENADNADIADETKLSSIETEKSKKKKKTTSSPIPDVEENSDDVENQAGTPGNLNPEKVEPDHKDNSDNLVGNEQEQKEESSDEKPPEKSLKSKKQKKEPVKKEVTSSTPGSEEEKVEEVFESADNEPADAVSIEESAEDASGKEGESSSVEEEVSSDEKISEKPVKSKKQKKETNKKEEPSLTSESEEEKAEETVEISNEEPGEIVSEEKPSDKISGEEEVADTAEVKEHAGEPTPPKYIPEKIDYAKLSKEDLVKVLKDLLDTGILEGIRKDIEAIKSNFYKKNKAEIEEKRKSFLADGGQQQDFKVEESPVESELKELLNRYRDIRNDLSKKQEGEKENNLEEKYKIIEGIKELINSQESLNRTFQEFRDLQNKWREIGPVPQQNLKDLWESYHYHVEAFYDYIKINKELRDLDLKKNLEAKIKLCETAEELLLEPSVVEAFRRLQKLHDSWREIGPVPIEKRSEIWERFKEATTKINRKHQEYFVNLKQEQKKNYEEKLLLCEKVEKINTDEINNHTEWEEKSRELIELQKMWKTIGFAPKKFNTQIYERFRKACDSFFDKKREYYSQNREEQQNNLQLKTELCIQAEALQESTDWKKTTDELIALQKRWKEIGPVPTKQSDKIWKRFRAACDHFFNNKSKYFSQIDTRYEENLEMKNKLIEEIENFELTSDVEKNLNSLKDMQRQWSEIGFVPLKHKNEIQDRYRKAINSKFDLLKLDENKKALLKFRSRIENIINKPNSQQRLRIERDKLFNKLKQMENDISLWENNIGFFADSENAESMINDVNRKIESARNKIEQLKGKIKMLDEYED